MSDGQTTETAETAPAVRPRVVTEALTGQTPGARAATPTPVLHSSDAVSGIIEALCKAQQKFGVVGKDRTANIETRGGGSYKYSYATLASVIAAVRPALNEQGIALVQSANVVSGDRGALLQVDTRFIHSSGQWLGSVLRLPLGDMTPQGMGSLLTYLRRYGLSALAGVASEEDDDGIAAAPQPTPRATAPRAPRPQPTRQDVRDPAPPPEPPPPTDAAPRPVLENELPEPQGEKPRAARTRPTAVPKADPAPLGAEGTITGRDRALLFKTAKEHAWAEKDVKALIKQLFGYESTSQLTPAQLTEVIGCIEMPADHGVSFDGEGTLVVTKAGA